MRAKPVDPQSKPKPPVINWRCQLTKVGLYNGCRAVVCLSYRYNISLAQLVWTRIFINSHQVMMLGCHVTGGRRLRHCVDVWNVYVEPVVANTVQ